jgi:hypothetical protein
MLRNFIAEISGFPGPLPIAEIIQASIETAHIPGSPTDISCKTNL